MNVVDDDKDDDDGVERLHVKPIRYLEIIERRFYKFEAFQCSSKVELIFFSIDNISKENAISAVLLKLQRIQ